MINRSLSILSMFTVSDNQEILTESIVSSNADTMTIFFLVAIFLLPLLFLFTWRKPKTRLPPGSLGIPLIGQSFSLLRAMRANTADKWVTDRAKKYGPVSKLSLFGKPTVFIYGLAANKLVFAGGSKISNHQAESTKVLLGSRNLLELNGEDHKRIRSALASFLKPDCLKDYVGKIEEEITRHLDENCRGKQRVTVLPLMKQLTFNIICSILFGVERGARRDRLVRFFQQMMGGMWSIPVNLPFTRYNRCLKARESVKKMLKDLISEKRMQFENGASSHQDLITSLLSIRGTDGRESLSEDEIIDNVILIMVAGHDTSSVLITFMIQALSNNPTIYASVLKEQEDIRNNKSPGDCLTWEDLTKMKYTWRVAMETLRLVPPIFGSFRKAETNIEYEGYTIPKGWQIFWVTSMTHMDDSIFPEPSKFDPSRYEDQASLPPYSYIPFGGGTRICPGYEFAKMETLVTLHYLVNEFTWELCCTDNKFIRDPMPAPTQGLPIQIVPRKPHRVKSPQEAP